MFGAITHGAFYASEIYEWQGVVFRFQAKKQRSTLQESRLPAPDQNLFSCRKSILAEGEVAWEYQLPSGKLLHNYGKIQHFSWVNPLFQWPFSSSLFVCLPEGTSCHPMCEIEICSHDGHDGNFPTCHWIHNMTNMTIP